jgi:uncharacterized integral membrane protein
MVMARIAAALLATVVFVAFALSNTHHVELSFVVGRPIEIRLIFLLGITFGAGVISTLFFLLFQDASRRAHHKKVRLQLTHADFHRRGPQ